MGTWEWIALLCLTSLVAGLWAAASERSRYKEKLQSMEASYAIRVVQVPVGSGRDTRWKWKVVHLQSGRVIINSPHTWKTPGEAKSRGEETLEGRLRPLNAAAKWGRK